MLRILSQWTTLLLLTKYNQWVVWKYDYRGDKLTKIPIDPKSEDNASATDELTWSDYNTALAKWRERPHLYKGLGFVFTEEDPFCVIDIDNHSECEEDIIKLISEFKQTYCEISPSGKGFHIVMIGKKPGDRCRTSKHPGLEIYDRGRFMTITGNRQGAKEITDCQDLLVKIYNKFFPQENEKREVILTPNDLEPDKIIKIAQKGKNGNLFTKLWTGNVPEGDRSAYDLALCNILAFYCGGDYHKIDTMFRQSGLMRDKWEKREDYRRRTIQKAIDDCRDFYTEKKGFDFSHIQINFDEMCKKFDENLGGEIEEYESVPAPSAEDERFEYWVIPNILPDYSDLGNAEFFAKLHKEDLIYSTINKEWYQYKQGVWKQLTDEEITSLAVEVPKLLRKLFIEGSEGEVNKKAVNWATTSGMGTHISKMIELAAAKLKYDKPFNNEPHLLNCPNGVVNLKNGELYPHKKEYYFDKQTNIPYNLDCQIPQRFLRYLSQVCCGIEERQKYLQRAMGYSATGEVNMKCAFFPYGQTDSGKSILLNIIHHILGNYAGYVPYDMFYKGRNGNFGFDELEGIRFAISTESSGDKDFNAEFFKAVTSGDGLKVPRKFKKDKAIKFICKLWFATNEIPGYRNDDAMNNRIKLIRFDQKFYKPGESEDPNLIQDVDLTKKLREEAEGILLWIVVGANFYYANYQNSNIMETQEMKEYKEAFVVNTDPVRAWASENLVFNVNDYCSSEELFKSYNQWCNMNNTINKWSSPGGFAKTLSSMFKIEPVRKRINNERKRFWQGVRIKQFGE